MLSASIAAASCCAPQVAPDTAERKLFEDFTALLARYNVNEYAASVKVYAVKMIK